MSFETLKSLDIESSLIPDLTFYKYGKSSTVQNVQLHYYHCSAHLEDGSNAGETNTRITLNILAQESQQAYEKVPLDFITAIKNAKQNLYQTYTTWKHYRQLTNNSIHTYY